MNRDKARCAPLAALLLPLNACALFADEIPCLADRNCPPDAPSCRDGFCTRADDDDDGGEGEGEGGAAEGESEGEGPRPFERIAILPGDTVENGQTARFVEAPDGIGIAWTKKVGDLGSDTEVRYGVLGATDDALIDELVVPAGTGARVQHLTLTNGGDPVIVAGASFAGAIHRRQQGTWSAAVPGPPDGFNDEVVLIGDRYYTGAIADGSSGFIQCLRSSPLDGSDWIEEIRSFENARVLVTSDGTATYAIFDLLREDVGADFTIDRGAGFSSTFDAAVGLEAVADLHAGRDGSVLAVGVDGAGVPTLARLEAAVGGETAPVLLDLVAAGAVADGDFAVAVTSDADGALHVVSIRPVGVAGFDVFYASDATGAFVSERVRSTPADRIDVGLAVDLAGAVYVGISGAVVDDQSFIVATILEVMRRQP